MPTPFAALEHSWEMPDTWGAQRGAPLDPRQCMTLVVPIRFFRKYFHLQAHTQQEHEGSCYPGTPIFTHTQRNTNTWHYIEVILTWQRCWLWPKRRKREQTPSKTTTQKRSIVFRVQRAKGIYKSLLKVFSGHLQIRPKSKWKPENPNMIKKGKKMRGLQVIH